MKLLILVGIISFSNYAFANGFECQVEKSVVKVNSETGKVEIRRAKSPEFEVTSAEHEDPKALSFIDESGRVWGSVGVVTGSYTLGSEKWFYANAIVTKDDGNIMGYLTLKMAFTGQSSTASSLIFDESEEMPPSLTLTCFQAADQSTI